jgi:hypothetical protein
MRNPQGLADDDSQECGNERQTNKDTKTGMEMPFERNLPAIRITQHSGKIAYRRCQVNRPVRHSALASSERQMLL